MYITISGKGSHRIVQLRDDRRVPGTDKRKAVIVKNYGNYEKLLAENPHIIEELKEEAKRLTREKNAESAPITLTVPTKEITSVEDVTSSFRFGHALIQHLWRELKLEKFFERYAGKRDPEELVQSIFYLLARRCTDPSSIYSCYQEQSQYAGHTEQTLDALYGVLDILAESKEDLIEFLSVFFQKKTKRKNGCAYYDVTTHSFESTKWGELRMFGFSKSHKNNEVQVVMGLLIDNNGIPVTYELFPGNTMDQSTLTKSVERLRELYRLEKITVVADRGLNSGTNLGYLCSQDHNFVISYTLKRSTQEFKELALNPEGWKVTSENEETGEVLTMEKVVEQTLEYKTEGLALDAPEGAEEGVKKKRGRPKKYQYHAVPVKIHLTWSAKRASKDRGDRQRMLEKLMKKMDKPYQLKAAVKRGVNQFLEMELETENWKISEEKIKESEKYDGYYAIITNNLELSTLEVVEIYRGLWRIEESFRIIKTDLQATPAFVWTDKHIEGHFAVCFLALTIMRYLQYKITDYTGAQVSAANLMEALSGPTVITQGTYPNITVTPININQTYLDISKTLGMSALRQNMTLTQFRSATKLNLVKNLE